MKKYLGYSPVTGKVIAKILNNLPQRCIVCQKENDRHPSDRLVVFIFLSWISQVEYGFSLSQQIRSAIMLQFIPEPSWFNILPSKMTRCCYFTLNSGKEILQFMEDSFLRFSFYALEKGTASSTWNLKLEKTMWPRFSRQKKSNKIVNSTGFSQM